MLVIIKASFYWALTICHILFWALLCIDSLCSHIDLICEKLIIIASSREDLVLERLKNLSTCHMIGRGAYVFDSKAGAHGVIVLMILLYKEDMQEKRES